MFIREFDTSKLQVPSCSDFVVYILKKESNMRVKRFYQCRCNVRSSEESNKLKAMSSNLHKSSNGAHEASDTADKNATIRALIQSGKLGSVPPELFITDESRKPCGKFFDNITKMFAHIRLHTNEFPYKCPVDGCTKRFC